MHDGGCPRRGRKSPKSPIVKWITILFWIFDFHKKLIIRERSWGLRLRLAPAALATPS